MACSLRHCLSQLGEQLLTYAMLRAVNVFVADVVSWFCGGSFCCCATDDRAQQHLFPATYTAHTRPETARTVFKLKKSLLK
jgi:hypothetical protein